MKKILTGLLILVLSAVLYASGETETYYSQTIDGQPSKVKKCIVQWVKETEGETYVDMNGVTVTLDEIYGNIDRITIDSNGTELVYVISLADDDGFTFFTVTDLNSVEEPNSFAVYLDDKNGDPLYGVPVAGACTLTTSGIVENAELQTCTPNAPADACNFTITYVGASTADIAYDANIAEIQVAFRLVAGCSAVTVGGVGLDDGNDLTLTWPSSSGNVTPVTFSAADTNAAPVTVVETTDGGSSLDLLKVIIYYRQEPQR